VRQSETVDERRTNDVVLGTPRRDRATRPTLLSSRCCIARHVRPQAWSLRFCSFHFSLGGVTMRFVSLCCVGLLVGLCASHGPVWGAPLEGYWRLNETSTAQPAVEETGNIPSGTYSAGVVLGVASPFPGFGTAASFNGSSSVNIGGGAVLNNASNFTVSSWVNYDNMVNKHTIIGAAGSWAMRSLNTSPEITAFGVLDYDGPAGTFTAGNWYHFVTVLDASNDARFYVNGVLVGTVPHTVAANTPANAFAIGAVGPGGGETMQGDIDDVAVFSVALTSAQIAAIYNLALEPGLQYELGKANTLLEAFDDGDAQVTIDGDLWVRTNGLGGASGSVTALGGGNYAVNLLNGAGFQTAALPEPGSLVLFAGAALAATIYAFRQRKQRR
jgi:hypothetical protein